MRFFSGNVHILLVLNIFIAILFPEICPAEKPFWLSYDSTTGNHIARTKEELDSVLTIHKEWLQRFEGFVVPLDSTSPVNLEKAILNNVSLQGALLIKMKLRDAILDSAIINYANLSDNNLMLATLKNADLMSANLSGANLKFTKLMNANLSGANLSGADLYKADLSGANLSGANLSDANLYNTNLYNTDLSRANLLRADLENAYLKGSRFEPDSLPAVENIAYAINLNQLIYRKNPTALILLKKLLQDAGFREQARMVNTSYRRALTRHNQSVIGNMETVFFDYTCEYGSNNTRLLWILNYILICCTFLYWSALHISKGHSGLYLLYSGKEVNIGNERIRIHKISYRLSLHSKGFVAIVLFIRSEYKALETAFFFSLMSAFNIGFREINFGRWIRLLQCQEFDLKANGWPRFVSGLQSLLSVYLVALWLLSQFGDFFNY